MNNQQEGTDLKKHTTTSINFNSQIIEAQAQPKAHTFGDDQLKELTKGIISIAYSMGFRDLETEIAASMAVWLKQYFGGLSMADIKIAFDLYTSKRITCENRHYATFGRQYVGDVLNAYQNHRNAQIKAFKEAEATKLLLNPTKGITGEEMYHGMKALAIDKGKLLEFADWSGAYAYAWAERLIHRMNAEERDQYKKALEIALHSERRGGIIDKLPTDLQAECHKRILKAHFQAMIN